MKLFRRLDTLIVAEDEADARKLLREQEVEGKDLRLFPIRQVRRKVELCNTSNHDERGMYTPGEVVRMHGRGLIPSL